MKRAVILGAGISGLSLAWFLKKKYRDDLEIALIEKSGKTGGWIRSPTVDGFLFEQGPRSCRIHSNGIETLQLVEQLGLTDEVLLANPYAHKKFLYENRQLQGLPTGLISLIGSPFFYPLIKALWNDWRAPKGSGKDETIHSFISRRLGSEIADRLMDPMVSGIYAGDIRQLSMQSCFREMFNNEHRYGSLVRSFFAKKDGSTGSYSPFIKGLQKHSLFTLKNGMETLTHALARSLHKEIRLNTAATALQVDKNGISVKLSDGTRIEADYLFSCLPAYALGSLLPEKFSDISKQLFSIPYASVGTVNLGYRTSVLNNTGFGYLIPTRESEFALGVVWDSSVFPQQNGLSHTRMTVMLGGAQKKEIEGMNEGDIVEQALSLVKRHLKITVPPDAVLPNIAQAAIPQYLVGHQDKMDLLVQELSKHIPGLTCLGSAFYGVSVNDCIAHARKTAENESK
jgi:protoporphyrinogen/coproporphyrinogen III oxidase